MSLRRLCLLAGALLCPLGLSLAQLPCPPTQSSTLPLQLAQLAHHRSLDDTCGCEGTPKDAPGTPLRIANDLQNRIKNNFRPATTTQKPITVADLIGLQTVVNGFTQAQLTRGDRLHLPSPSQRTLLRDINLGQGKRFSEGDLVTLVGFVIGARHSNTEGGESVNCNLDGCAGNDIHVDVTANPRNPQMSVGKQMNREGVSAEISPHHRPDAWETFDAEAYGATFKNHPVMFTGQLFYDASHSPGGGPNRAAVWELHPVYAIWVCRKTSLSQCLVSSQNDPNIWTPFHQVQGLLHLNVQATQKCLDSP